MVSTREDRVERRQTWRMNFLSTLFLILPTTIRRDIGNSMRLGSPRRRSSSAVALPSSSRRSQSQRNVRLPDRRDLYLTKAKGFRPKSRNTIPIPSSMKCGRVLTLGAHYPTRISGKLRRRPLGSYSTGGNTSSATSVHSSAKSKR